jgi:hypothetical protein
MTMMFKPAVRKKAKLRLGLSGPSNSGKTYSALLIASGLVGDGGKIALIDTENGSGSLYAGMPGIPAYDCLELTAPYSPERFIEAITAAEKAGYDAIIIDSTTHEWSGAGGCLEINDTVAATKFKGNGWAAWNETTPRHRKFIDKMLQSPCHIIATMRSKTDTTQSEDGGRKRVIKLGMKAEQRDGTEYEFTVVLDLMHDSHVATVSKDRTGGLFGDPHVLTAQDGLRLREWLESGKEPLTPEQELEAMNKEVEANPDQLKSIASRMLTVLKGIKSAEVLERHIKLCQPTLDKVKAAWPETAYPHIKTELDTRLADLKAAEAAANNMMAG